MGFALYGGISVDNSVLKGDGGVHQFVVDSYNFELMNVVLIGLRVLTKGVSLFNQNTHVFL